MSLVKVACLYTWLYYTSIGCWSSVCSESRLLFSKIWFGHFGCNSFIDWIVHFCQVFARITPFVCHDTKVREGIQFVEVFIDCRSRKFCRWFILAVYWHAYVVPIVRLQLDCRCQLVLSSFDVQCYNILLSSIVAQLSSTSRYRAAGAKSTCHFWDTKLKLIFWTLLFMGFKMSRPHFSRKLFPTEIRHHMV